MPPTVPDRTVRFGPAAPRCRPPAEPAVRVTGRGPGRGAADILLLQTTRDPATSYQGALGMRSALGRRAVTVTVEGGNHGAYDQATPSCAVTAADRFLATGALPAHDLSCRPDPAPDPAPSS